MLKKNVSILMILGFAFLYPYQVFSQIDKENKSVEQDLEFPCAPKVRLKKFEDKQNELNTLPPPIPPATAPTFKKWQIVIGREFDFKATPNNNAENWQWKVGDDGTGNGFWSFDPPLNNPPINNKNKGTSQIPDSEIPINNGIFGTAKGNVRVSAEIEVGQTTEVRTDEQEIKIFYSKDDMNFHNLVVPNWFFYWSQVVEGELTTSGIRLFEVNDLVTEAVLNVDPPTPIKFTLEYREDGSYSWPQPPGSNVVYGTNLLGNQMNKFKFAFVPGGLCANNFRKVLIGYPDDLPALSIIQIGKGCGYHYPIYNYGPGPNAFEAVPPESNIVRGVDVFYALVNHELMHWKLIEDFWSQAGYDSSNDCDWDFYPNDWEMGPIGESYGFDPVMEDKYSENYDPENLPNLLPIESRAATWFQEEKCRRTEMATQSNSPHSQDWSFDPSYKNQGKNW